MFFKPLITPKPRIGKFQNWAEIKVNYPTNNKKIQMDFSDNFCNIKKFVQVDHIEKIMKNRPNFSFCRSKKKNASGRKIFLITKIEYILVPDYCVNISGKLDHHALQKISSNPIVNISGTDNKI
jgi:hypothetical protein